MSMVKLKNTLLSATLLLLPAWSVATENVPVGLTAEDARALVLELMHEWRSDKLRGFSLEQEHDDSREFGPDFYWFNAMWAGTPEGSVNIGSYAVDKNTGDVWGATACMEYQSKSLRKLQDKIRKKLAMSPEQYRQLRKPGPYCD